MPGTYRTVLTPQPSDAPRSQPQADDSFLDLLVETLESVERPARGQFLQKFFKTIAQLEISDEQSLDYWEQILLRRQELSESLGKRVSLKTAMVDVLASTNHLRVPILIEYGELKKLQSSASTDALTGLYNRRMFEEYCDKELNRAKRYAQHLGLVLLDLHRLKEVNDRYGHPVGDQALQLAAVTLRKTIRASDFAFRIGGDEFALLLPQADPEQATTLCRRLRTNYEAAIQPLKLEVPLTIDFGVTVHPQDGDQKAALIRLADERLYLMKQSSRGQARVIPLEHPAPREAPLPLRPAAVAPGPPAKAPGVGAAPQARPTPPAQQRKWERVSLAGTHAYAVLGGDAGKTAPVLDLSYGGVAFQVERADELAASFQAVLHVPILPPVRVSLQMVYMLKLPDGRIRVGCSFVS